IHLEQCAAQLLEFLAARDVVCTALADQDRIGTKLSQRAKRIEHSHEDARAAPASAQPATLHVRASFDQVGDRLRRRGPTVYADEYFVPRVERAMDGLRPQCLASSPWGRRHGRDKGNSHSENTRIAQLRDSLSGKSAVSEPPALGDAHANAVRIHGLASSMLSPRAYAEGFEMRFERKPIENLSACCKRLGLGLCSAKIRGPCLKMNNASAGEIHCCSRARHKSRNRSITARLRPGSMARDSSRRRNCSSCRYRCPRRLAGDCARRWFVALCACSRYFTNGRSQYTTPPADAATAASHQS